jgi:hypothetical protein
MLSSSGCGLLFFFLLSGTEPRPEASKSETSAANALLSPAVLERMKQRRASIQDERNLSAGRKRNSIDLSSFGKGLVVETF